MTIPLVQSSGPGRLAILGAAIALAILAGCGETTVNAALQAARIEAVGGAALSGPAGLVLPDPIEVLVFGSDDQPLPGAAVTFSAANGGSVNPATTTTDGNGIARTRWTLGKTAGPNALTATAESGVSLTLTATATAGRAATVTRVAGDNQTAAVGTAVPIAPSVRVADAFGNLVAGVPVTFSVLSGGGGLTNAVSLTNSQGIATVGSWILGPFPGVQTLAARVEENGVTNNPVIFTATGVAGPPVAMVALSSTTQTALAGSNVNDPPSVIVRDASAIPVSGVVVTFTVTVGGGSVVGSPATTNANGVATLTSWRLGVVAGPNTVVATAVGPPSVTFNATGTAGLPANVVASAGDNQTAVQGTAVPVQPTVKVTDASGNAVPGVSVSFAVVLGGGSATGLNQVTDALGLATVASWTLGSGVPNTLQATVAGSGIIGNPVNFTAQSATQIAIASTTPSPIARATNFIITAQLQNAAGAPVALPGVSLTIAIASGGGTLNGTLTRTTDASGLASFTSINVTGGTTGDRTFTVTGTGLLSATTGPITFNP